MEVILGKEKEVGGVEADVAEAGGAGAGEVAEEGEQNVLFVETSSKGTAGLVQNVPFPTIYRTRMSTNLQRNLAKDWQTPLSNNEGGL
jgi:hypothetical protein